MCRSLVVGQHLCSPARGATGDALKASVPFASRVKRTLYMLLVFSSGNESRVKGMRPYTLELDRRLHTRCNTATSLPRRSGSGRSASCARSPAVPPLKPYSLPRDSEHPAQPSQPDPHSKDAQRGHVSEGSLSYRAPQFGHVTAVEVTALFSRRSSHPPAASTGLTIPLSPQRMIIP